MSSWGSRMEEPAQDAKPDVRPPGPGGSPTSEATWGPKLFTAALVAVVVFFWWLVIYSHGVAPHHG